MNDRQQMQAQRLFAALSEVDDALLSELVQSQIATKKPPLLLRIRSVSRIAVAALLFLTVLFGGIRLSNLIGINESPSPGEDAPPVLSAQALLLESVSVMEAVDEESQLDFFSGTPMLICRFTERGDYYTHPLSGNFSVLNGSAGGAMLTAEESKEEALRIWVCDGKGNVRTPQLTPASGNLSYGCLLDYSPELAPGEEVWDYLRLQLI